MLAALLLAGIVAAPPRYEAQPGEFSADGAAARWLGTCCPAGWEPAVR